MKRSGQADRRPQVGVPGLAVRQAAAKLLGAVIEARTSLDGLTDEAGGHPAYRALEPRDRSLLRAMLGAALRHRGTIRARIDASLDRPLPGNAHTLSHILHIGAAQLLYLDIPDHAAVGLAVEQAKADPRTRRFDRLVNAVLRGIGRARDNATPQVADAPEWLVDRLVAAYGKPRAEAILAAHRLPAPVDFTVKHDPELWATRLGGIVLPTGTVRIARLEGPVIELPGFAEGEWWVQDAAAALPARLLGHIAGHHVADLCAAPGGKTAQLANAGAKVTAVEIAPNRLKRLRGNLERLKLDAEIVQADLTTYEPDAPFDAVLLDAPCSSTGTIRRHPDVAWTKTADDVVKLAAVQRRLLDHAIRVTRPGGAIVFSNCSLMPEEGEDLVSTLLSERNDIEVQTIAPDEFPNLAAFVSPRGFLRTTPADLDLGDPAMSGLDGFFAARLCKR